ncbi:MAG: FkbM family methyltransferase, partial [Patescibacteria group bacterium]|nr:FkbM family methyltransferase [Patescibacteria group bacterium]
DRDGELPFYATRIPEVGSLLKPADRLIRLSTEHKYDYDIIAVTCSTLDRYCRRHGIGSIDIAKIDVQGNELAVLKGAAELLANNAIVLVYLEIILAESYEQQSGMTRILDLMAQYGYALWDIMPFLYTTPGRVWTANAMFLSSVAASTLENAVPAAVPPCTDAHP